MKKNKVFSISFLIGSLFFLACAVEDSVSDWPEFLGGPGRNQYSKLTQINRENVSQLSKAWEYHTGDSGQIQCNPIIIDGVLYGMTATTRPFAIDAASGKEIWRLPTEDHDQFSTSRGLSYWGNGKDNRIYYTKGEWLYALHAKDGTLVESFGENGKVSLKSGLGKQADQKMVISNAPGTIYKDLIIMPLRVSEGTDAAMGHIQAFNVITGALEWVFHTIPKPGEFGFDTWPEEAHKNTRVGGANNWAGMALDTQRGIIYIPTGSAAYDFYGKDRPGQNLFANTLLALDAATGNRIWHYQIVHHDILDRDLPSAPNLLTIHVAGKQVDVVTQTTKHGYVFVFDRETGEPVFPIDEKPVPQSDIPGEQSWPTQPVPKLPAPFARQTLAPHDISPYAENKEELKQTLASLRNEGPFTPLSLGGSIVFPGLDGGAEWGGAAADPEGVLYVNSSEMAWILGLGPSQTEESLADLSEGARVYQTQCAACHMEDRSGNPLSGYPALDKLEGNLSRMAAQTIIQNGKGMMPAFTQLSSSQRASLLDYLYKTEEVVAKKEPGMDGNSPIAPEPAYKINRFSKFLDSNGLPAISPPWGTLSAIDLNTGMYKWKIAFGEYPELVEKGIPTTGAESYGGPIVTQSGLLFIAGTKDKKLRAYDKETGKLLWEGMLPAAGFATPSTYIANGRQYVVIACGGNKLGAPSGDSYVAFALPQD
ncbi:Glucose dehydrogenase, PQQ-dependent [Indibacter alkaliphilus LW1]|uniref:Glucose dehydrogenase, PQQ-dependent n=1 Tax=Indibacter alkaliphilus (strain CCUG 57479 / KCTC 22604 / LW1) TaxID=1189612 RepID=S2CWG6_INDAL|nr:PQQ-binding-like beta-propeller repeat protein [Indibacter alkaliphilus]EOZ91507.1 Glucose dehydrogenase, PQQ-dependent [Indibacter alkaliphilus LW1]